MNKTILSAIALAFLGQPVSAQSIPPCARSVQIVSIGDRTPSHSRYTVDPIDVPDLRALLDHPIKTCGGELVFTGVSTHPGHPLTRVFVEPSSSKPKKEDYPKLLDFRRHMRLFLKEQEAQEEHINLFLEEADKALKRSENANASSIFGALKRANTALLEDWPPGGSRDRIVLINSDLNDNVGIETLTIPKAESIYIIHGSAELPPALQDLDNVYVYENLRGALRHIQSQYNRGGTL